jgi:D-glycero-D-manno-heptose 1,7-bisphosphate phosphatase
MGGTRAVNAARPAVFLDRDGTLNAAVVRGGKPYPPASAEDLIVLPGVASAVSDLRAAGYLAIVVTNQPDVATGKQSRSIVESINAQLRAAVPVDDIRVCYHSDADRCGCRKPKPGMLIAAAHDWGVDLSRSFMIGDRWRDVEAGRAAGCRTFLIEAGYDEERSQPDFLIGSVEQACNIILGRVPSVSR